MSKASYCSRLLHYFHYFRESLLSDHEKSYMQQEINAVEAVYQITEACRQNDWKATDEAMDDNEQHEETLHIEQPADDPNADPDDDIEDNSEEYSEDSNELLPESTRCAAHTCQLAVWDVLKRYETRITAIKKLVLMARQTKYKETFLEHKASAAPQYNATRWNGVYLMLKALREQKPFFLMLENKFPELGMHHYL